jgi:hypothetical protein
MKMRGKNLQIRHLCLHLKQRVKLDKKKDEKNASALTVTESAFQRRDRALGARERSWTIASTLETL